ncbi:Concanavalin A-like lectin protein kinase family protein [Rhynchospora pubera]|uniref:non-specific serine/threonine protein kinase n=1 Tax=Rhynchospora pubera TaxID=906938 RepID=A0AAV8CX21_9POAL|nr:Concanavalin A-like lectin protein kinase family protein [Rhynchospora pubera]
MLMKTYAFAFLLLLCIALCASQDVEFTFNGFTGSNLMLDGVASIESNGLLRLTNSTSQKKGHAFYPSPVRFGSNTSSFSTTFVFVMVPEISGIGGQGMAFVISPTNNLSTAMAAEYLGLFNKQNEGKSDNHIFAVEFDTIQNEEYEDINNNHVGIDINSLTSNQSEFAGYYDDDSGSFQNLSLMSHTTMQVWVEYESEDKEIKVTLSPVGMSKPNKPLLSYKFDLSVVLKDTMYIGFSSSTGSYPASHYVLGWSFKLNGTAPSIDLSKLPEPPHRNTKELSKVLKIVLPSAFAAFVLICVLIFIYMRSQFKYAELLEDWEVEFGPHRFSYKDLHQATNGFKETELLGAGGFGRVYRGVLSVSKLEVAIKRVSHGSKQGMKQFIAEVVSIGRLRHRNLVQLFGYCRRRGELLLVYDYMPNGSLDQYLYSGHEKPTLNWIQRFKIIKGVAAGLLYLHEEWEQVVVHRDIKASNVLLDSELNGRLGDFGLAILYDHGTEAEITNVVGTMGYLAPELTRTGKASPLTDVFAFGAFMLEVVCGRRPVEPGPQGERIVLVDLVLEHWKQGSLANIVDPRLRETFAIEEIEMVLKLSLLCSHPLPGARPTMQQVMQYLDGSKPLPDLMVSSMNYSMLAILQNEGFDSLVMSYSSQMASISTQSVGR